MTLSEQMYEFSARNGYGTGFSEYWSIRHFEVIEEYLLKGEEVRMSFLGILKVFNGREDRIKGFFGFALTKDKIIYGKKHVIGKEMKEVYIRSIRDVSIKVSLIFSTVVIDAIKETINIMMLNRTAKEVYQELRKQIKSVEMG